MNSLDTVRERLLANPFYALSLSSRELFHSNFLEWLLRNYPQMIFALSKSKMSEEFELLREAHNLDLVIRSGSGKEKRSILVELKVKDAPRIEQLKRYDEKIEGNLGFFGPSPEKLLISLLDAPPEIKSGTWRVINLLELGGAIEEKASSFSFPSGHRAIIRLYIDLCRDLQDLVDGAIRADIRTRHYLFELPEERETCDYVNQILKGLRFSDTVEKHRASLLCEEIRRRWENESLQDLSPEMCSAYIMPGFDRGEAHAGATIKQKVEVDSSNQLELNLGIHIQGTQYRRMLSFSGFKVPNYKQGKDQDELRRFICETDGWKWMFASNHSDGFFDCSQDQGGFFEKCSAVSTRQRKSKLLLSYAPHNIYQYTGIGIESGVPIDKIVDAVVADLRYATQLLSDDRYLERFDSWFRKQR